MAAYAVVFAVEVHNRGRKSVETLTITSDNCMLTSMDIEVTETGDVRPGHHVSAGIFQALAKQKGMQRCAHHQLCAEHFQPCLSFPASHFSLLLISAAASARQACVGLGPAV
jgi:hypothetical protein